MMTFQVPLACDGCFYGWPAIISLAIIIISLIGTIYMLLASNFGARKGYLILMVSLGAWMLIQSALWLIGAPGTAPGTGPRGREPAWIPFTPTSEVAREDHAAEVDRFPNGWQTITDLGSTLYPGNVSAQGEFETIRATITDALARLAADQGEGPTKAADWRFRPSDVKPSLADQQLPAARVAFVQKGSTLLFGAEIPATGKFPATRVFAYRDKGLVFLPSLIFTVASLAIFVFHLWLLARLEEREKADQSRLEPAPTG